MNQELRISLCSYTTLATLITCVMIILPHPNHRDSLILFPGNLLGPSIRPTFWERIEAPLPSLQPRCNFIHPRQLSPFPERLELPFFDRCNLVRLRGYRLLRNGSLYCVGQDGPSRGLGTSYG